MAVSTPILVAFVVVAILATAACSSELRDDSLVKKALPGNYRDILENADKFELMTISCRGDTLPDGISVKEHIDRFGVVDTVEIADRDTQLALVHAFYESVKNGHDNIGNACFDPHHGIRAEKGGQIVTVLVCFKCNNFAALPDGVKNGIVISLKPLQVWRDEVKRAGLAEVAEAEYGG